MKILQLIFFLLLTAKPAIADTKDITDDPLKYDIEIIIFEDAHSRYINSEAWRREKSEANELNVSQEGSAKKAKINKNKPVFNIKDPKMLKEEYKRINHSSEYNVLHYSAWRQTGLKSGNAFEIDIAKLNNSHRNQTENTISGKVKIVLARYLHFYGDLEYQQLNKANDGNGLRVEEAQQDDRLVPATTSYTLSSHRRMRSKELHYIDHPLVGILIQINPVEVSLEDQAN